LLVNSKKLSSKRGMKKLESEGIIASTKIKIELELKRRGAFEIKTALDAENAQINFLPVLDVMEKSGLIEKTSDGKVYMTRKGQEEQLRGFSVSNNFANKKFVRFSRNK
jgi:hypothetical protein